MTLRLKLSFITIVSALIVSVIGVGLLYGLASTRFLQAGMAQLKRETRWQVDHQIGVMRQAEGSLIELGDLLTKELAEPPRPDEAAAFDRLTVRGEDGVIRSRRELFDGKREAGLFMAPGVALTAAQRHLQMRVLHTLTEFGASALRHFDGVWFDQLNKTSVIFQRRDPDLIYKLPAGRDRTQTAWNQLASPRLNPKRIPMWTPAVRELPLGVWVVSAVYPLDIAGQWEGILGHDLVLTDLLQSFRDNDPYAGSEHFLIDGFGNYVLAGTWQQALEARSRDFRPDLSAEPQLQAVLQGGQTVADGTRIRSRGQDYAVFSLPLEGLNWRYYRLVPVDSVLAQMNQLFVLLALLFVAMALAVATVIHGAAARMIVSPIRKLAQTAQRFGAGDFSRRGDNRSDDEVGQLDRAFDTMAQQLEQDRQLLLDNEARYRSVVEDIKEVVYQVDAQGRFTYLSPSWEVVTGYRAQDSLGQFLWHNLDARDRVRKQTEFQQVVQGVSGADCSGEYRLRRADGQLCWVEINLQPSQLGTQAYTGSMGDITARTRGHMLDALFHELGQEVIGGIDSSALLAILAARLADIYACITILSRREHGVLRDLALGGTEVTPRDFAAHGDMPYVPPSSKPFYLEDFPKAWRDVMDGYGIRSGFGMSFGHTGQHMGGVIFLDTIVQVFSPEVQTSMLATAERIRLLMRNEADQRWLRLINSALETTVNAALIARADGSIKWVNAALVEMSGYAREEIIGQTPRLFNSGAQSADFWRQFWLTVASGQAWVHEVINRHKDGRHYPVRQTVTPIRDGKGAITHYISVQENIQQEKEAQAQLQHLATHDLLTDLPNRNLLLERLRQAINSAQRADQQVGILFIDLDRFKLVNDSLGHVVGDELLRRVADRLRTCLRVGDTLARLGGDEFVLLLPGLNKPMDAAAVAEKLLEALTTPVQINRQALTTGCSIGISLYPTDSADEGILLQHADTAMYMAKERGRSCFQFYVPEMNARVVQRMEIESDLRRALANREFVLHYQPQIDIQTLRIVGVETLLRWQHPVRGLMSHSEFISVAEETGLIVPIGEWVLQAACDQLKAWQAQGLALDLSLAVNVSVRQFKQGAIVQSVRDVLARTGIAPQRLELEITESLMLANEPAPIALLHQLHDLGVRLALDDFGTGFSSLAYLKRLPFDVLKIDRSFVKDIGLDHGDDAVIISIIGLAHNLGMTALAEGVETEPQRDFLRRHGCDFEQGYLFSRPLPAVELAALLRQQR